MGTITLKTIRDLLAELNGQCPHLGEWVVNNVTWCFKAAPPTTGGLCAVVTDCTLTVHIAVLMHDHVCTYIYI